MNTASKKVFKLVSCGIHFLFERFVQPISTNEDSRRKEFILNVILIGSIGLLTWSNIFIILEIFSRGIHRTGVSLLVFNIFTILFCSLYWLSRKGYSNISSYSIVFLYFIGNTYASARWGPNLPAALLGFALVIVISSILISTRFSFVMGGLIFATITTLGYLEQANKILPDTHWKKEVFVLGDAVEYSLLLFVILIISWLSNREIEKSLHRARSSEADLIKERDLLEIKVDERTQALRKAQLEKMSELYRFVEFGRLSSGVFHDLINPLNALSLNVGLLKSVQEAHTPEMQAYIQKALTASAKMETYIATVRKQIQMNNSPSTFCLNEEIQAAITVLEYKAKKNNVQMLFIEVDNINMYGSSIKFHQIATNLISNAIDAYDGFESTNSRIVLIELATSTKQIVFTVKDFGIGISIEIQKEIFEPFFTTKHSSKGSGLGLSTTKHIIERDFKGTISVSSQEPLGTIFEVLIPLSLDTSQDEQNTSKV